MGLKGFFDSIAEGSGLLPETLSLAFRVVMMGKKCVYIEGIKGIDSYSSELVRLRAGSGFLSVKGKNLTVRELNKGEITLCGEISGVEIL